MRILNLFADADGESHFREIDIDCTNETPWGLKYPNGFRLQPFFLSKARARTLMSFSSHRIRRHAGNM